MFAPQLPVQQLLSHATQLHRQGNYAAAVEVYRQLLRSFPNNAEVLDKMGAALAAIGQTEEARRHIERAIKIAPDQAVFHHDLHLTYKREGRLKEATEALQKALRLAPRQPSFTAAMAEIQLLQMDYDGAMRTLEPVRAHAGVVAGVGLMYASLAPRYGQEREAAEELRRLLGRSDLLQTNRIKAQFALAYLLDFVGDYDGAWEAARTANAIRGTTWSREQHTKAIDGAIAAWTPEAVAAAPRAQVDASFLTLVLGMPRCGAGLVTQTLLTLDPQSGFSAELNDLMIVARDLQGMASTGAPIFSRPATLNEGVLTEKASIYLNRIRGFRPGAKIAIDRLPMNFLNLGLIASLLPGARIVLVHRDPMDCAVSSYLHMFQANYPFMHDAPMLGSFMRDGRRLVEHWKRVLPSLAVHEVAYEDLLSRPEATVRSLVEFHGHSWNEQSLKPAREWVTTVTLPDGSMRDIVPEGRVGIAKDYEKHVGPMRDAMSV